MKVLLYNELDPKKIPNFRKMQAFLEADDFRSAEVKKVGDNLYRARLDMRNRLLFSIHHYAGERYALVLEFIANHAYERSRFLAGNAVPDEDKIPPIQSPDAVAPRPLAYVNPVSSTFNLLDKIISFDEVQETVYRLPPPMIVIGSAGSGKTALTLEKMKESVGDILYVTRSRYLVHNSRSLYCAAGYENEDQQVDFLAFDEYLQSIRVPEGREMSFREFSQWFERHRIASGIKDPYQVFEEFKGVLTGGATGDPYLSREAYSDLGVKQSIFSVDERQRVYGLFEKYLVFMREHGYYDANILSHGYLKLVTPRYDFVVVDEVQDLTGVQLQLVLESLRNPGEFILCGDSNQIVHPNFFSWAKIKTLFYRRQGPRAPAELIRILNTNYRNTPRVTEVANRILKIKNARFGAIDKESNYLVKSNAHDGGEVLLLPDRDEIKGELNRKTRQSTRFAVIVMHPDQKAGARRFLQTPLIFSVQEAKGLEYENIILYNFASDDEQRFREITRSVDPQAIEGGFGYARSKDKTDKSLEIYKFHINALYVAITRAVQNIYLMERNPKQRLFDLLGLKPLDQGLELAGQDSSLDEWRQEAHRLELQGKQEQADEIRSQILKQKSVPWEVLSGETLAALQRRAIDEGHKKAKLTLFEYALVYYDQGRLNALIKSGFAPARTPERGRKLLNRKSFMPYESKHPGAVLRQTDQYGVDFRDPFNQTPLMIAARFGNAELVGALIARGADPEKVNNAGLNAFCIALEQACAQPKFASHRLAGIYALLEADSIAIQVEGRLIKLDNRGMEFLMFSLMMAMFYTRLGAKIVRLGGAFQSADFVEVLAHFPDRVLPERRKKRAYLSSILAKNELHRDDPYNRKLFYRIRHGHYIINPNLSVKVEGEWRRIYELLPLERIDYPRDEAEDGWAELDMNGYFQEMLAEFRSRVHQITS